jgi:hypothetical protein
MARIGGSEVDRTSATSGIARPVGLGFLVALLFSTPLLAATPAGRAATTAKSPLYGDPAHPDISGMWDPAPVSAAPTASGTSKEDSSATRLGYGQVGPRLTPAYAARHAKWLQDFKVGKQELDPVTRCLAFGAVRFGTMPVEIIQTPGQVTLNVGVLHDIRRIYVDAGHTAGADPSFNGDSIGHWEGDTLVVETNNVRASTFDRSGVPYSDKITMVERYRLVSPKRLEIESVLTDPEAFLAPYTMKRAYVPMPAGSRFEEYVCENNQDLEPTGATP